jgi:hypothetical protein
MAHNQMTPRKGTSHGGGGCTCGRCGGRFAKGGQVTPAWKDRPYAVPHKDGSGLKIHAPTSGSGLVMHIHLSDVGPHAISFGHGDAYSGGVDSSRMVERQAMHRLTSEARPTPFPVQRAPAVAPMDAAGFGALMGKLPYS